MDSMPEKCQYHLDVDSTPFASTLLCKWQQHSKFTADLNMNKLHNYFSLNMCMHKYIVSLTADICEL